MNTTGYIITATLSVGLLLLLAVSGADLAHARLRVSACWLIVALSGILIATTGRLIPGGPFVSLHSDVFPVVGCIALLAFGAVGFRFISAERRLVLVFAMLASIGLIGVVVTNVLAFWRDPFARGALFAW
ncbi:MAG: hypothetical protein NT154_26945 [Verrucomicrobia bacterium]|nr:hypothetical protein [Verrucomicrobiota bacterium]